MLGRLCWSLQALTLTRPLARATSHQSELYRCHFAARTNSTGQRAARSATSCQQYSRMPRRDAQDDEEAHAALQKLLQGSIQCIEFSGDQLLIDQPRAGLAYLAGSFNPLHNGHRDMLEAALQQLGWGRERGCYELSVGNPDKGVLPVEEVLRRLQQFRADHLPIVVTHALLYTQKAQLFADSAFVVGYDTAIRLVAQRYYNDDEAEMLSELKGMRSRGCQVLVAGRVDKDGAFRTLEDIKMSTALQELGLFRGISEEVFRSDISSTQLRERTSQGKQA